MSDHDFFTSNGLTDHGESLFDPSGDERRG